MKPIKVLHIVELEKEAHYFNNLVDMSDPAQVTHSFVTFAPEGPFSESLQRRGSQVFTLGYLSRGKAIAALRAVLRIDEKLQPDIIHTHLITPTFIGLMVSKLRRRKSVTTRHHSDAIHVLPSKVKRHFYLGIERFNAFAADRIIAPSRMVRHFLVDRECTPVGKVAIIPYGQLSTRFDAVTPEKVRRKREELGMDSQLSLVCVSRLFPTKGHKYLFEAIKPIVESGHGLRLYLLGEGKHREELERLVRELGISGNVSFLGWRADADEIIASADLIVHPSLEDALSQALIESLMLARPIVATDISGAADTLDGGKYGRLVPPADAAALRDGILETLSDLEKARATAAAGRDYILEYMGAQRCADQHLVIYKELVNAGSESNSV